MKTVYLLNVIPCMGKKKKSGEIKEEVLTVALGAAVGTIVERVISCILDCFFK